MDTVPTIGRIVHLKLAAHDAERINALPGAKNEARAGDVYPAMIVRVWPGTTDPMVQLQVFFDGDGCYWATSRRRGDERGAWSWPTRA